MSFYEEAEKKLEAGKKAKLDRYGEAMKKAVGDALLSFARQDEEFAQAIVQGGEFSDCMKAVAKAVKGGSISDIDAYTEAVKFYFPGAGIRWSMTIDLCASVHKGEEPGTAAAPKVLSLEDFF